MPGRSTEVQRKYTRMQKNTLEFQIHRKIAGIAVKSTGLLEKSFGVRGISTGMLRKSWNAREIHLNSGKIH